MTSVEENKQLVLSWYEASMSGDTERWLDLIHDDFRSYISGNMPLSGWQDDPTNLLEVGKLLGRHLAGSFTLKFGDITAEDDRVLIEGESDGELANGKRYYNFYVWSHRVRDGKIVELKEFVDTHHVYETFDAEEFVRGEPKERETPIGRVTHTFEGPVRLSAEN
jgi:uncharacterized protein